MKIDRDVSHETSSSIAHLEVKPQYEQIKTLAIVFLLVILGLVAADQGNVKSGDCGPESVTPALNGD